jgi:hypothetical protein
MLRHSSECCTRAEKRSDGVFGYGVLWAGGFLRQHRHWTTSLMGKVSWITQTAFSSSELAESKGGYLATLA